MLRKSNDKNPAHLDPARGAKRGGPSGDIPAAADGLAEDLEGFGRFRAARGDMGEWGRRTWALQRARLMLTREEAARPGRGP